MKYLEVGTTGEFGISIKKTESTRIVYLWTSIFVINKGWIIWMLCMNCHKNGISIFISIPLACFCTVCFVWVSFHCLYLANISFGFYLHHFANPESYINFFTVFFCYKWMFLKWNINHISNVLHDTNQQEMCP